MAAASNEVADTTLLPKEVGKRLRLLREQAGLSQEAVAGLMGLEGPGGKSYVCWVERGYLKSGPGFVRLLDYLRACGYGMEALLDILDRYTAMETVPEEQASRGVLAAVENLPRELAKRAFYYHVGMSYKAKRGVPSMTAAAERVRRAVARANSELRQKRLHRVLNDVVNELNLAWDDTNAIGLRSYGRLVFATLRRLRKAREGWKRRAMTRLDAWPVEKGLEPKQSRRMKEAVMELFRKMDLAGGLD